jgi:hypothetical protein
LLGMARPHCNRSRLAVGPVWARTWVPGSMRDNLICPGATCSTTSGSARKVAQVTGKTRHAQARSSPSTAKSSCCHDRVVCSPAVSVRHNPAASAAACAVSNSATTNGIYTCRFVS